MSQRSRAATAAIALVARPTNSDATANKVYSAVCEAAEAVGTEDLREDSASRGRRFRKSGPFDERRSDGRWKDARGNSPLANKSLTTSEIRLFWKVSRNAISERGGAKPRRKTILDPPFPIAGPFEKSTAQGLSRVEAIDKAATAGDSGLEATKFTTARHGRAASLHEESLGHQDIGAAVGLVHCPSHAIIRKGRERRVALKARVNTKPASPKRELTLWGAEGRIASSVRRTAP